MNNNNPFTEKEQAVMASIVTAHNAFMELEKTHPMELGEWLDAVHRLQGLLMNRSLRRQYPDYFSSIKKTENGE